MSKDALFCESGMLTQVQVLAHYILQHCLRGRGSPVTQGLEAVITAKLDL